MSLKKTIVETAFNVALSPTRKKGLFKSPFLKAVSAFFISETIS